MIKNIKLISIWSEGIQLESSAKYNEDTKEVFDITFPVFNRKGIGNLDKKYILFEDGTELIIENISNK